VEGANLGAMDLGGVEEASIGCNRERVSKTI
jgi:hypothetical protein